MVWAAIPRVFDSLPGCTLHLNNLSSIALKRRPPFQHFPDKTSELRWCVYTRRAVCNPPVTCRISRRCLHTILHSIQSAVRVQAVPFANSCNQKTLAFFLGAVSSAESARGVLACSTVLTTRGRCQRLAFRGADSARALLGAALCL